MTGLLQFDDALVRVQTLQGGLLGGGYSVSMPLPSWCKVRLTGWLPVSRSAALHALPTVLLHVAGLGLMLWSERGAAGKAAYLLAWFISNCFWLAVLRRPAAAAALSLAFFSVLVLLSRFKHDVLFMTVTFVDLIVVDP